MPELPELLYILSSLQEKLLGRPVTAERVKEPVVLRYCVRGNLSLLLGRALTDLFRRSHFLAFRFQGLDLAVNPMLAGRFRLADIRRAAMAQISEDVGLWQSTGGVPELTAYGSHFIEQAFSA